MSLSFLIDNFSLWWPIYKTAILYNVSIFIGATGGSFALNRVLNLMLFALTTTGAVSFTTARWLKAYFYVKALLTPFIFVAISWNIQLHRTVKPNENIFVDRILLNFNGASGLLTPERHIVSFIMRKGIWLYFTR